MLVGNEVPRAGSNRLHRMFNRAVVRVRLHADVLAPAEYLIVTGSGRRCATGT